MREYNDALINKGNKVKAPFTETIELVAITTESGLKCCLRKKFPIRDLNSIARAPRLVRK